MQHQQNSRRGHAPQQPHREQRTVSPPREPATHTQMRQEEASYRSERSHPQQQRLQLEQQHSSRSTMDRQHPQRGLGARTQSERSMDSTFLLMTQYRHPVTQETRGQQSQRSSVVPREPYVPPPQVREEEASYRSERSTPHQQQQLQRAQQHSSRSTMDYQHPQRGPGARTQSQRSLSSSHHDSASTRMTQYRHSVTQETRGPRGSTTSSSLPSNAPYETSSHNDSASTLMTQYQHPITQEMRGPRGASTRSLSSKNSPYETSSHNDSASTLMTQYQHPVTREMRGPRGPSTRSMSSKNSSYETSSHNDSASTLMTQYQHPVTQEMRGPTGPSTRSLPYNSPYETSSYNDSVSTLMNQYQQHAGTQEMYRPTRGPSTRSLPSRAPSQIHRSASSHSRRSGPPPPRMLPRQGPSYYNDAQYGSPSAYDNDNGADDTYYQRNPMQQAHTTTGVLPLSKNNDTTRTERSLTLEQALGSSSSDKMDRKDQARSTSSSLLLNNDNANAPILPPLQRSSRSFVSTQDDKNNQELESYFKNQFTMDKKHDLMMKALVHQKFHLPGNSWWQDWRAYFGNNHPIFGICFHDPNHPVGTVKRLLLLLGSMGFGLFLTNVMYIVFLKFTNDVNATITLANVTMTEEGPRVVQDFQSQVNSMTGYELTLWLVGGPLHGLFDHLIWFLDLAPWFQQGGCLENYHYLSSFLSIFCILIMALVAFVCVIIRGGLEQNNLQDFGSISSVYEAEAYLEGLEKSSFDFLLWWYVELAIEYFFFNFIVGTLLFSGWLSCGGCIPKLGGRPKEVKEAEDTMEEEEEKLKAHLDNRRREDFWSSRLLVADASTQRSKATSTTSMYSSTRSFTTRAAASGGR